MKLNWRVWLAIAGLALAMIACQVDSGLDGTGVCGWFVDPQTGQHIMRCK